MSSGDQPESPLGDGVAEGTTLDSFLNAMKRRLRFVWALSTANLVAPVVVGLALLTVLAGWVKPWTWPEPLSIVVLIGAFLALVGFALLQPLSTMTSALAADRGLDSNDAFSAAVQFKSLDDEFGDRIRHRANTQASVARSNKAAPLLNDRSTKVRWVVAGALLAGTIALIAAANPQDAVRERRYVEQAAIATLAEQVAELAAKPEAEQLVDDLETLAEEVAESETLEQALASLELAEAALEKENPSDFASKQTAAQGLSKSLEQRPLAGTGEESAPEQLDDLANSLDDLDSAEKQELAERLDDLSETQAAGDPATAAALSQAAEALAAGDNAAAAEALSYAAQTQSAAASSVAAQQSANAVAGELGQLSDQAAGAAQQQAGAQSPDQGQGEGQSGQGQGESQGQSGQGQGESQEKGGQGFSTSPFEGIKDGATTIDPEALEDGSSIGIEGSLSEDGRSENLGSGDGPTLNNQARVPIADVAGNYAERASDALDREQLSPSQERLVGDYFDRLTDGE